MLRNVLSSRIANHSTGLFRPFALRAGPHAALDEDDLDAARQWLSRLNPETLPTFSKGEYDESFSRSSGPGGQNVNKVNSKATLTIEASALLSKVPSILHPAILKSTYFKSSGNKFVIQSERTRSQSDNRKDCWLRLHNLLAEAGSKTVPGKTSAAQEKRVKELKKNANESRLKQKKARSDKKSGRKGGGHSNDY